MRIKNLYTFKRFILKVLKKKEVKGLNICYDYVRIQPTRQTLWEIEKCIEAKKFGAYLRFGDGDVFLLNSQNDSFQMVNQNLTAEMQEAFALKGLNLFKTLPIHSDLHGFEEGMFLGNHKNENSFSKKILDISHPYFIGEKIYSHVALHYLACTEVQRANSFLKILKSHTRLFIGNKNLNEKVIFRLFGNVPHIKTPERNSYDEIDRVYNEALDHISKIEGFFVICIGMGCSGRILMKRLLKSGYTSFFLFDFGSLLDGMNGEDSRTWLKVNEINYDELTDNL